MTMRGGHARGGVWGLRLRSVQKVWSHLRSVFLLPKSQLVHSFLPAAEIWRLVGQLRGWSLGPLFWLKLGQWAKQY